MALYKYSQYLSQSSDAAFDRVHEPGTTTPHSGIYRCEGCGREVACNQGQPLPPQNHHQHPYGTSAIRWRLAVATKG
jgi:hypothetical protein